MFIPQNRELGKKLASLVPEIQQIVCARFINFLTINTSVKDQSWSHNGQLLHNEHMHALAYLQSNFKNHIVSLKGIENFKNVKKYLFDSENNELLQNLEPPTTKLAEINRKKFYIYDEAFQIQRLMQCNLMQNKSYTKILCFPRTQPFQMNQKFEKFCIDHNVKALGLTNFSLKGLLGQIFRTQNRPTLIHELVGNDSSLFKEIDLKLSPTEIILFVNQTNQSKLKGNNLPTFKELMRNYVHRQTFSNSSKPTTKNFNVLRFQHIEFAKKYIDAINDQEKAQAGEQQD